MVLTLPEAHQAPSWSQLLYSRLSVQNSHLYLDSTKHTSNAADTFLCLSNCMETLVLFLLLFFLLLLFFIQFISFHFISFHFMFVACFACVAFVAFVVFAVFAVSLFHDVCCVLLGTSFFHGCSSCSAICRLVIVCSLICVFVVLFRYYSLFFPCVFASVCLQICVAVCAGVFQATWDVGRGFHGHGVPQKRLMVFVGEVPSGNG